ncbi:hypothetical protein WUBG_14790 [Wuchereria bancrofti]|nr:hypothetical protein WUBG_14790 [Wuchereria bancrofti]
MQIPVYDHSRYPSVEGSSLTSNFTAAVAAAAQPRHERYAAHIPVTRIDGNGRQSTTSIDSHNRLVDELFKVNIYIMEEGEGNVYRTKSMVFNRGQQ